MLNADIGVGCGSTSEGCEGNGSCPVPPDFCIKRNDTRPSFRVAMSDCDGPVDLTEEGIVVEASMWFDARLKSSIGSSSLSLKFADDIGFGSVKVGDVIVATHVRTPERMLVVSIDESTHEISVTRGYESTDSRPWDKGVHLKVFRFRDEPAAVESVIETVDSIDGSSSEELTDTLLVFEWTPDKTSMPGCYWFEFKVLKLAPAPGSGDLEWVKRVPLTPEGYMVNIVDSQTFPT